MEEETAAAAANLEKMDIDESDKKPAAKQADAEMKDDVNSTGDDETDLPPLEDPTNNNKENKGKNAADDKDLSDTSSDEGDGKVLSTEEADEKLLKAAEQKEQGNAHFKAGELDKASRCYRRGINHLKNLNQNNSGDEQVKHLLVALHTNLSMMNFKLKKYKQAAEVATKGLAVSSDNVKLLYRRAVALRQSGDPDGSVRDLRRAIKIDPSNNAAKKELHAAKKEMDETNAKQKAALAKAFAAKGGKSLLYDDKEQEEKRKAEENRKKAEEAKEMKKKRKQQWEDECVKRMAKGEPAITFEEWEKEQDEEKKRKEKEEEKRRKEERKKLQAEKAAAKKASSSNDDDDDSDIELTKEELAMMRGYKKTKDGRTTSYFTRELSESEQKALGDIAPKRIESTSSGLASADASIQAQVSLQQGTMSSTQPSAWNAAGTWEEKDTSSWCTNQLRTRLEETIVMNENKWDADVVKVENLDGHGSMAHAAGRKRYIFEYHTKLKYEIKDSNEVVAKGALNLPDICSTTPISELEILCEAWSQAPPSSEHETMACKVRDQLVEQVRSQVRLFVKDFNETY